MLVLWHNQTPQGEQFSMDEVKLLLKVLRKQTYEQLIEIGLSSTEINQLNTLVLEMQG